MVVDLAEVGIEDLQRLLASGETSSAAITRWYTDRIRDLDRGDVNLRSIIEVNPDALSLAEELDSERIIGRLRGPLHGIPILVKDNIDTADAMDTTAGSFALEGVPRTGDAFVVRRLRQAGALILGKANMSEWANFRGEHSISGWSARGGQARNPYVLDRSPCGSSSGSATAVAANLAASALGTETDGSILCPASVNGVVGIKPTLGLCSQSGVIPIAHSQDTVGPFGRTVADAALVLSVIAAPDPDDPATLADDRPNLSNPAPLLDPDGLRGARIGVARKVYSGYNRHADRLLDQALDTMRELGATIVDPANIPTASAIRRSRTEFTVLLYEFKSDLNAYLGRLNDASPIHSLGDLIQFNCQHADNEMPYFGQELLERAQKTTSLSDRRYQSALAKSRLLAGRQGIDAVMEELHLDALVAPTRGPAFKIDVANGDMSAGGSSGPTARAGYPAISVPAGFAHELPIGISFMGRAFSEPTLLRFAYAYEQATKHRRPPHFIPSIDR